MSISLIGERWMIPFSRCFILYLLTECTWYKAAVVVWWWRNRTWVWKVSGLSPPVAKLPLRCIESGRHTAPLLLTLVMGTTQRSYFVVCSDGLSQWQVVHFHVTLLHVHLVHQTLKLLLLTSTFDDFVLFLFLIGSTLRIRPRRQTLILFLPPFLQCSR